MSKEYTRDATEYGQLKIVEALQTIGASVATDTTLSVSGKAADAKATGDAIGSVASDGDYIKKSTTKNVCENLVILDTRAKTNADAIALKADTSTVSGLISDDGTTKTLFGLVVSIDADTGVVSLSEPVVESSET